VLELITPVLTMGFEASDSEEYIKVYDTHIMGRFDCTNSACPTDKWSSKWIALTIRLYEGQRYNAKVWHQRCRACDTFGHPTLDDTYAERIAYRLKVWFRKYLELVNWSWRETPPHESDLCEGCKHRHCQKGIERRRRMI